MGLIPGQFMEITISSIKSEVRCFLAPKPSLGTTTKKIKAYHVKPEFGEALVHHHWDVYQEGPFMYEIG